MTQADGLERLAGGVLWPGFLGREVPAWLADALAGGLAGVVYFAQNLGGDTTALSAEIHRLNPRALIGIDEEGGSVTGRVFEACGQFLAVAEGWQRGPSTDPIDDPTKLGPVVADLLANARRNSGIDGQPGTWPQPQD